MQDTDFFNFFSGLRESFPIIAPFLTTNITKLSGLFEADALATGTDAGSICEALTKWQQRKGPKTNADDLLKMISETGLRHVLGK